MKLLFEESIEYKMPEKVSILRRNEKSKYRNKNSFLDFFFFFDFCRSVEQKENRKGMTSKEKGQISKFSENVSSPPFFFL